MADTPYPIPRGKRVSEILSGNGGATYGPFSFKIFDIDDVVVSIRHEGEQFFTEATVAVQKVSQLAFDFFTITFPAPLLATSVYQVRGSRVGRRSAGTTRGTLLNPDALEKELSKIAIEAQELRRDVDLSVRVPYGALPPSMPTPAENAVIGWKNNAFVNRDPSEFVNDAGFATADQGERADGSLQSLTNLGDLTDVDEALENLGVASLKAAFPNPSASVQGTGTPGIDGAKLFFYRHLDAPDEAPTLRLDRRAEFSGGVSGHTPANLWLYTTVGPHNIFFEWGLKTELHNRALGTGGSENVALNATAFKEANGIGEVGKTWGGNIVASDLTGMNNPSYALVGLEVNAFALAGTTDNNRQRIGLHMSLGGHAGAHIGDGIMLSSTPGAVIDHGISFRSFAGSSGAFGVGIDTTDADITSGVALMMREGQSIAFDGHSDGAFARRLFYSAGLLAYKVGENVVFTLDGSGNASFAGTVTHA